MIKIIGTTEIDFIEILKDIESRSWDIKKADSLDYYKPTVDYLRREINRLIDNLENIKKVTIIK